MALRQLILGFADYELRPSDVSMNVALEAAASGARLRRNEDRAQRPRRRGRQWLLALRLCYGRALQAFWGEVIEMRSGGGS